MTNYGAGGDYVYMVRRRLDGSALYIHAVQSF